ncbi:MAG: hypothetical protein KF795_00575 [Labilithrix sp.]|nr:hypothetical protein [Labilithrix sp.]
MFPNLTIIIASYVVVRLATLALRQFPRVADHFVTRASVAVVSVLAVVVVVFFTVETIDRAIPDPDAPKTSPPPFPRVF